MTDQESRDKEILEASEKWLKDNDWDYQKYGDRRPDRSAYDTHMNYEVSDLLDWAFTEGADWQFEKFEKEKTRMTDLLRECEVWINANHEMPDYSELLLKLRSVL